MTRAVDNIRNAAERATTLTQQLLAFARKQHLDGRAVNLNNLVEGMRDLSGRTLGDGVAVRTELPDGLWNARIDPTQTEVALLNILINARDAMPDGGTVTIRTENHVFDIDELPSGLAQTGRYVSVSVTDTGLGMPPEILARVMEPFFTTKEEGRGTGLGLAMVYGFAKQSGGTVVIESRAGHGTTVRLYFPMSDSEERPAPGRAIARFTAREPRRS